MITKSLVQFPSRGSAGPAWTRKRPPNGTRVSSILLIVEDGETPCASALRVMRDEGKAADVRMHAARIAAPYIHPRPQPEPRYVAFHTLRRLKFKNPATDNAMAGVSWGRYGYPERTSAVIANTITRLYSRVTLSTYLAGPRRNPPFQCQIRFLST